MIADHTSKLRLRTMIGFLPACGAVGTIIMVGSLVAQQPAPASGSGTTLGGIPLQVPKEGSAAGPQAGGIPLIVPRETTTNHVPLAERPLGQRMGGPGRMIGQRMEVVESQPASYYGEPPLPLQGDGYFPTQVESAILSGGNADYPRSRGDRGYWAYSGLWPVRPAPDNFYQRNGAFFDRVERGFRTFIPEQNLLSHSGEPYSWAVDFNYGLPFITQDVAEDRVMWKLGPLYIDVLGVSATALYTQYSGDVPLQGVEEDGWIAILGLPVRASLRISDTLYIQATGFFYYLPLEGEFGVSSGIGSGWGIGTNVRLNYEWESAPWMFRVYDYFGFVNSLADITETWEVGEIDAVGRYRFGTEGFGGRRGEAYWDPQFGGYRNDVGFEAQRPFENEWWFLANLVHSDYWSESDFDDDAHGHAEQIYLTHSYMGDDLMFAPSFGYRGVSTDYFDNMTHEVFARFTGRMTEYLTGYASVGYLWQTGEDTSESIGDGTVTWEAGLNHDLTSYTSHSLSGGQVYSLSEQLDQYLADYIRYSIRHSFSQRFSASAYIQWEDSKNLDTDERFEGWKAGGYARYVIGEDTALSAGVSYYTGDDHVSDVDREGWLYYASLQRPILSRLNGTATYQYTDERGPFGTNYTEHLLIFSLNFAF